MIAGWETVSACPSHRPCQHTVAGFDSGDTDWQTAIADRVFLHPVVILRSISASFLQTAELDDSNP